MEWLYNIIQFAFSWINIPAFPASLAGSIDSFLSLVFDNLSLLGFFIRPTTIRLVVPVLLIVINFELIYKLVMWIVRKLPFISIQ
ncbi:MAG: hypothetical protein HFJ29_01370 [Clostridia bacterium]|nr:hypothetical protein [Clostridia bacterium]